MRFFTVTLLFLLFFSSASNGQKDVDTTSDTYLMLEKIQKRQNLTSRIGMFQLGGFAVGNITYGSIAYFNSSGEAKYFHQMNAMWNVVNLAIAVPGIIKTFKKKPVNFESVYKAQKSAETIYLFNAGLDLGYIATGWGLRNLGNSYSGETAYRLKGYGSSLMFQGGFLFLHDIVEFIFYKTNGKHFNMIWDRVSIEPLGLGFRMRFH